ncbi:Retrovirus-related Pol polyprotein from transposon RE1 [Cardamine amara subsp. amara]|uniref:Retrovirus-related Pol polyprotein from transposon RE1 n=1 Tax=Cardamine amara subsp. amara TaxID=228776 RepID=A0ABD1BDC1_CARAN
MVDRQFNKKLLSVRSDNGTEFMILTNYFRSLGINHETSCVGTPQQNGRAERKHRHILNVARALRFQANLPIQFWGECILTAGYLINRTPSTVIGGKTPFEMLYNKVPDYAHLRVFGSLCYSHNQAHKGDKFASRSRKCAFVGYPYGKKGWRLYDLETKDFFVSRDVIFYEDHFPFIITASVLEHGINDEDELWAPLYNTQILEEENWASPVQGPQRVSDTAHLNPSVAEPSIESSSSSSQTTPTPELSNSSNTETRFTPDIVPSGSLENESDREAPPTPLPVAPPQPPQPVPLIPPVVEPVLAAPVPLPPVRQST